MKIVLIVIWALLIFTGCTSRLKHMTDDCQKSAIKLSEILKFDKHARTYHVEKSLQYAKYSNDLFWQTLFMELDCHVVCELDLRDAEKIFGVKLKYDPQGNRFKHDGKGILQYSSQMILETKLTNNTPDIVFLFTKDGKRVKQVCFYYELY